MLSHELQLVLGICAIVISVVWVYKAFTTKGLPGVNTALYTLLNDVNRLDRIESTVNTIRNQSPQHEMLIATTRALIMDFTKTIQQVQLEALKIGLALPFNDETAKLLANISKVTDVVTDQLPNTPSADVGLTG